MSEENKDASSPATGPDTPVSPVASQVESVPEQAAAVRPVFPKNLNLTEACNAKEARPGAQNGEEGD